MASSGTNIPNAVLPVTVTAAYNTFPLAVHALTPHGRPSLYFAGAPGGGIVTTQFIVTSNLAEQPMQAVGWTEGRVLPMPDPIVQAYLLYVYVVQFPGSASVRFTVPVYASFSPLGLNNPVFHFFVLDLVSYDRNIIPAATFAEGDMVSFILAYSPADPLNNYPQTRNISAALHLYFTGSNVLLP